MINSTRNLFNLTILIQAIENLVRAWKDNTLEPEQFGLNSDSFLAKDDLIVGDTEGFQNDILSAITFLQVQKVEISQVKWLTPLENFH